jgi:hypothetical protein
MCYAHAHQQASPWACHTFRHRPSAASAWQLAAAHDDASVTGGEQHALSPCGNATEGVQQHGDAGCSDLGLGRRWCLFLRGRRRLLGSRGGRFLGCRRWRISECCRRCLDRRAQRRCCWCGGHLPRHTSEVRRQTMGTVCIVRHFTSPSCVAAVVACCSSMAHHYGDGRCSVWSISRRTRDPVEHHIRWSAPACAWRLPSTRLGAMHEPLKQGDLHGREGQHTQMV